MLYLHASALLKRYVKEDGSDEVLQAMTDTGAWTTCRIAYAETVRAVALAGGHRAIRRIDADWPSFDVVEVDTALAEHAAQLALSTDLRSLDALHLASALILPSQDLTVATWDARLHRAVQDQGLRTLPYEL